MLPSLLGALVGAFVGALVAEAVRHRLAAEAPDAVADAPTRVVSDKRREANRRLMEEHGWHDRYRCAECDLESTKGGVGKHHAASGHTGRVKV